MKKRNLIVIVMLVALAAAVGIRYHAKIKKLSHRMMDAVVDVVNSPDVKEEPLLFLSCVDDEVGYVISKYFPFKTAFVRLGGLVIKAAGTRSYYSISEGMNITSSGYNVRKYEKTSTDYEVEQITSFKEYLDEKGINLLYVNEPYKYIDDDYYLREFGEETYLNRNVDCFLERIGQKGIDYLDLRECINDEGIEPLELFYRTDHHWTVPASEWAAARISRKLNECCGYDIDLSLYDPEKFNSVFYKEAWLGEQGRLVADTFIGLDDYTMM